MVKNKHEIRSKLPSTEPIELHLVPLDVDSQKRNGLLIVPAYSALCKRRPSHWPQYQKRNNVTTKPIMCNYWNYSPFLQCSKNHKFILIIISKLSSLTQPHCNKKQGRMSDEAGRNSSELSCVPEDGNIVITDTRETYVVCAYKYELHGAWRTWFRMLMSPSEAGVTTAHLLTQDLTIISMEAP